MEQTISDIRQLVSALRELGVVQFEGAGLKLVLLPEAPEASPPLLDSTLTPATERFNDGLTAAEQQEIYGFIRGNA